MSNRPKIRGIFSVCRSTSLAQDVSVVTSDSKASSSRGFCQRIIRRYRNSLADASPETLIDKIVECTSRDAEARSEVVDVSCDADRCVRFGSPNSDGLTGPVHCQTVRYSSAKYQRYNLYKRQWVSPSSSVLIQ